MRRYNAPALVFRMPYAEGVRLLEYAEEQENDLKLYARWVVGYQNATTFTDFKNKLRQEATASDKGAEEILQTVENILKRF